MDFYGTNTYNNFLLSIPKKQAKSYEIDLGQNNGAYDEELLIRYGDNTLNHMKNKNRGGNLNMDDIMKMNEQLRPFQERQPPEEGVISYAQMCEGIEENIASVDDSAVYLTDFEKNLNKAIEVMTNDIFTFFDNTYNEFNPKLLEKYSYLKSKIKEQKDENANLLKQIDFLLQENTQIMDMVYKVGARLEKLEKKAGVDKPQEPDMNEIPQEVDEGMEEGEMGPKVGISGEQSGGEEGFENLEGEEQLDLQMQGINEGFTGKIEEEGKDNSGSDEEKKGGPIEEEKDIEGNVQLTNGEEGEEPNMLDQAIVQDTEQYGEEEEQMPDMGLDDNNNNEEAQ